MSAIATSGIHLARIAVTSRMVVGFLIFFALFQVALAVALMAERKGYGFGQWLLFGVVAPIAALSSVITMRSYKDSLESRHCPACGDAIPRSAVICRTCRSAVRPVPNPEYLTWSVEAETGDWGMPKRSRDAD